MGINRRRGEPAIPGNFKSLLSRAQFQALRKLEPFGWSLHVVRRPRFEPVEVVLEHSSGKYSALDIEGELEHEPPPQLRAETISQYTGEGGRDPWANANDDSDFFIPEVDEQTPTSIRHEPVPRPVERGARKGKPPKKILV
jgi:hypothetical protein